MTKYVAVLVLAGALVLWTGACGGGDDAAAEPDAFHGTYWFVSYLGQNGVPDLAQATWGTQAADGFGSLTPGVGTTNVNGTVSAPPSGGGSSPYLLDASGRLAVDLAGVTALAGGVGADGGAAVLASAYSPLAPAVVVFCRAQGSFDVGSLDGLYHFVLFAYDAPGTTDVARWGTVSFSAGTATVARMSNVGGLISSTLPFPGNYFVAPDGQLDLTLGTESFRGGILEGGEFAVLGGTTTGGGNPTLLLLVKGSAAASLATLAGTYHAIGLEAPAGGTPEWTSYTTTATADGLGGLQVHAGLKSEDGTVTALAPTSTTYTVAADGTLVLGGGDVVGGVAPSGRFAIYGGPTVPATGPLLWILIR